MREDLVREFPEAVRAIAWTRARLPARTSMFRHEPTPWATVSGIGAGFLVSAIVGSLVGLVFVLLGAFGITTPLTLGWLSALLGTAVAVAVALRAGGTLSLALYLAYLGIDIALKIPSLITFCERSGFDNLLAFESCTPWGFFTSHWHQWTGIGVGLLMSRNIVARDEGANPTLRVAGTYAIAWSIVLNAWSMTMARADPAGALNASLMFSVLAVAAAVTAGVVAARSVHRVRTATIVAVILVLPWLTVQLPFLLSQIAMAAQIETSSEFLPAMLVGTFSTPIAAIVLVLAALVADRQRFIPRDTA
jgi:hypothetical protein